ncbi:MAG: uroporphyrinogen decarboxylase family protein [Armatimonadota bacterium]
MTPRENTLRVINFDNPEYVPMGIPCFGLAYNGSNHQSIDGTGGDASPAGSRWFDIWGVGWHKELADVMGLPEINPLADLSKVEGYPYPDPYDLRICGLIHECKIEYNSDQAFLAGTHRDTLFEQAYMLVGMENLFIAFYEEPDAVKSLLHNIIDFQLGLAKQYVEKGIEWAFMGDDLGHQQGLLFSRDILDEFFVPEYRRLMSFYKEHGVRICFHSCGQIQGILDMFMDLGIDVLNPVQATANDLAEVRRITEGRMSLMGAISSHLVYEGPVERIQTDVKEKIELLAKTGGYFCGPDQGMPFPPENIDALVKAVEKYGCYPIVSKTKGDT